VGENVVPVQESFDQLGLRVYSFVKVPGFKAGFGRKIFTDIDIRVVVNSDTQLKNDPPAADHTEIVIEDIFRISCTKELAGFCDLDLRNSKDSRRLLWHGSGTSNIAGSGPSTSRREVSSETRFPNF
jgi:hypothetical protein